MATYHLLIVISASNVNEAEVNFGPCLQDVKLRMATKYSISAFNCSLDTDIHVLSAAQ